MDTAEAARSDFAARLYDELAAAQAGKNLFLSPFSVGVALAMCGAGARGETRRVLADLIGAPQSVEEQNRQYAQLLKGINSDGDRPFQLVTANALWGQQGYHFQSDFKTAAADFYGGAFHEVNFAGLPEQAVRTINAWVSDQTYEKIRELIQRDFMATLLAQAMRRPLAGKSHRPRRIHVRGHPQWRELFPHLDELGIRVAVHRVGMVKPTAEQRSVETLFPAVAQWVWGYGHIEIGDQEMFGYISRAVDDGGVVFEDDRPDTLAEAMAALEKGLAGWFKEQGIDIDGVGSGGDAA
jgi:hypothetical protein